MAETGHKRQQMHWQAVPVCRCITCRACKLAVQRSHPALQLQCTCKQCKGPAIRQLHTSSPWLDMQCPLSWS